MNIKQLHQYFLKCNSASTDTRNVITNDLFFALKGDNFNGNKFAAQALEKGAKYAVIDEADYALNSNYILVEDVLTTLQELAKYHRQYLGVKIIALTGSNGKTTTKELINTVLSKTYNTTATVGNLNNQIGVPLTLLSMNSATEIGIVEMGANHQKEIEFLCDIAQPDYGYITNFGKAHLEGFGGTKGVIKGKSELYNYLISNQKHIFLNADDTIQLKKLSNYIKKFGFSQSNSQYYNITLTDTNPFVQVNVEEVLIQSNLIGAYNFTNICASIIIGKYFNVPLNSIQSAIENYKPTNNRSQIIKKTGNQIILDAYNANPTSMTAALDNFSELKNNSKIAILGDMFELGETSSKEHQTIADYTLRLNIDTVYLIGNHFFRTSITHSDKLQSFETFEAFKTFLETKSFKNATLLIKGSRGMALERVLDLI